MKQLENVIGKHHGIPFDFWLVLQNGRAKFKLKKSVFRIFEFFQNRSHHIDGRLPGVFFHQSIRRLLKESLANVLDSSPKVEKEGLVSAEAIDH